MRVLSTMTLTGLLIVFCNLSFAQSTPQGNNPGVESGKKIGETIKAAIETVLPIYSTVTELIWPDGQNGRIKKDELEEKIKESESEIKEKIKANFQKNIRPLSNLVTELELINQITEPAILCQKYLSETSIELNKREVNWSDVKTSIKNSIGFLNKISTIQQNDIDKKIADITLAYNLKNLQNASIIGSNNINSKIEQKDVQGTLEEIDNLLVLVEPAARISSIYVTKILIDISELNEWSKGPMGDSDSSPSVRDTDIYKSLETPN